MRTRTIVVLVVVGAALLALAQRRGPGPERAEPARRVERTDPVPTEEVAPAPPAAAVPEGPTTITTGLPPAAAPVEIERRGMGSDVEQRWPLVLLLPKDTPGWRVDYRVDDDELVLTVSVRAVLNRPEQLESYRAALGANKAEALEWLRSVGDLAGAVIEWTPPEAATL